MRYLKCLLLCWLPVLPAWAQLFQPSPHFDLHADPPALATQVVAGYLPAARNWNQAVGIGHRYFYDEAARTYYGYDFVVQPEGMGGRYLVDYYDLSIGPLDFTEAPAGSLNPTVWKKLPLSALPATHSIKVSEVLENVVFVDPSTGQKLIDSMYLTLAPQTSPSRIVIVNPPQFQFHSANGGPAVRIYRGAGVVLSGNVTIPTMPGMAREFAIDDAQMTIQQARVTINDVRQQLTSPVRLVSGSLIWFYVPEHGRYVLSLLPRTELGFVKAGEVRGGKVSFSIGDDRVQLESPAEIAPGNAPYFLYVLHDADWVPTGRAPSNTLLAGSVSAAELAALARK